MTRWLKDCQKCSQPADKLYGPAPATALFICADCLEKQRDYYVKEFHEACDEIARLRMFLAGALGEYEQVRERYVVRPPRSLDDLMKELGDE